MKMQRNSKKGVLGLLSAMAFTVAASPHQVVASAELQGPLPDYDVVVEIRNTTGEPQADWPVIITVYKVFGRNLPVGTLNPSGFRVYDEQGREIPYMIEALPPYDQVGNDELVFIVPHIAEGQTLRYRVTNTSRNSTQRTRLDVVGNRHNLLVNAGFEQPGRVGEPVTGWPPDARLDGEVKRAGSFSARLRGTQLKRMQHTEKIRLQPGCRYYFGIWGKTEEVSRHGIHTSRGGYFTLTGLSSGWRGVLSDWRGQELMDAEGRVLAQDLDRETVSRLERDIEAMKAPWIFPQCYTRPWYKSLPLVRSFTDWGLPEMCMTAIAESADLAVTLDQRPQFVRPSGQAGTWWLDDAVLIIQPELRVRFDELLAPQLEDGVFVFTRPTNMPLGFCLKASNPYCTMPYPRERADRLERFGLKGQRVVFLLGVYHTRPLGEVTMTLKGGALVGPEGRRLPLTEVEWAPGFLPAAPAGDLSNFDDVPTQRSHLLHTLTGPADLSSRQGMPYFVLNFVIPRDAFPGSYRGTLELTAGGRTLRSIPTVVHVQDMAMPILRDIAVGPILQTDPLNDETMRLLQKTGFTGVNVGPGIFKFVTGADGKKHVDLDDLGEKIRWIKSYGITAAVTLWGDADLGPQWGGGRLIKAVDYDKQRFLEEVKRVEEYCRKHSDWPRLIWMTWDEPQPDGSFEPGGHGKPCPKMGWVTEAVPDALTTVDAGFWVWDKILPYFTLPNLDEPADYAGPEVYEYTRKQGKNFGFAGSKNDLDERVRYQVGMMLIASGAKNFQFWHLTVHGALADRVDDKLLRSLSMVATGEGLDDLKIHRLLQDAMKRARESADPGRVSAAEEADSYLRDLHKVWNADHTHDESLPYLGLAADWGYDQFYQDWQKQMARYAAACLGVKWVGPGER